MNALRSSSLLRRALTPVLLVAWLTACTKWHTERMPVVRVVDEKSPALVRVTRADYSVVQLRTPRISGDSLVGFVAGQRIAGRPRRIAIPLDEVRLLEVRKTDALKTTLLLAGIGFTIAAVVAAANEPEPVVISPGPNEPVSCPLVYSWDGRQWVLDSGTFGGAFLSALSRTDVDNLDFARAEKGTIRLRLAAELAETDHVDALSVLAVDHEPGVTVAPDGSGALHALGALVPPLSARDYRGHDARPRVRASDGWNWESSPSGRDTARAADLRDGLEIVFPRPAGASSARLVLDGQNTSWAAYLMQEYVALHGRETRAWYDSLNADAARAVRLGMKFAREAFLNVAVWTAEGWESQGLIWEAGPEIVKRQVLVLDLSRVRGDTLLVRLESAPSFWLVDRVAVDYAPERPFSVHELTAETAVDRAGRDVRPLLAAIDGEHYVMERGDFAELAFPVPDVPDGLQRTYVLRTTGWYRIHSDSVGEPDAQVLARIESEPGAISRLSVARMNEALSVLARGGLR